MSVETVTLNLIESHLWESANILRGPVDAADFKIDIFPLLFFKRISDVYNEELRQALEESGGDQEYAELAELHRLALPKGCHWQDMRQVTFNVGQALQKAFREKDITEVVKLLIKLNKLRSTERKYFLMLNG